MKVGLFLFVVAAVAVGRTWAAPAPNAPALPNAATYLFDTANNWVHKGVNALNDCSGVVHGKPKDLVAKASDYAQFCVRVPGETKKKAEPLFLSFVSKTTNTAKLTAYRLPVVGSDHNGRAGVWDTDFIGADYAPGNPTYSHVGGVFARTGLPAPGGAAALVPAGVPAVDQPTSRGHMAPSDQFTASDNKGGATFLQGANTFPSFNAGAVPYGWDGDMWNHREVALKNYAKHVGTTGAVYVVVGTGGDALFQIRRTWDNMVAAPNPEVRGNLIDVPSKAWTAVYDSENNRGLAWVCSQHAQLRADIQTEQPCHFKTINEIRDTMGVNPFPSLSTDDAASKNKDPSAFAVGGAVWHGNRGEHNQYVRVGRDEYWW